MSYIKIGSYTPATAETPAIIDREYYGQGFIFKDGAAFHIHPDQPCYIPELSDAVYTRQDFIKLCGGREDFAEICFDIVDWQSPESWIQEQFTNAEWDICPKCGHWYSRHTDARPCAKCGGGLEYEIGRVSVHVRALRIKMGLAEDSDEAEDFVAILDQVAPLARPKAAWIWPAWPDSSRPPLFVKS